MHMNCVWECARSRVCQSIWHTNCPETLKINCTVIWSAHGDSQGKENWIKWNGNCKISYNKFAKLIFDFTRLQSLIKVTVINLAVWGTVWNHIYLYSIFHLHCGRTMYWGSLPQATANFAEILPSLTISVAKLKRQIGASSCLGLKQIQRANIVITVCGNPTTSVSICECVYMWVCVCEWVCAINYVQCMARWLT